MLEREVERLITAERLRSYAERTRSTTAALRLYEWNMRAAASVMELTGLGRVATAVAAKCTAG